MPDTGTPSIKKPWKFENRPRNAMVTNNFAELAQIVGAQNNDFILGRKKWKPFSRTTISSSKNQIFYVILNDKEKLIAAAAIFVGNGTRAIESFAIHPDERQKGYGGIIMKQIMKDCENADAALYLDYLGKSFNIDDLYATKEEDIVPDDDRLDILIMMGLTAHASCPDLEVQYPHNDMPVTYENILPTKPEKPITADEKDLEAAAPLNQ